MAVIAESRCALTMGSMRMFAGGIGGGPSGLPFDGLLRVKSTLGLSGMLTLLPEFSGAPPAIHFLMTSSVASGSFGSFGGMNGSLAWVITLYNRLVSGSPGLTATPEAPPCITAV